MTKEEARQIIYDFFDCPYPTRCGILSKYLGEELENEKENMQILIAIMKAHKENNLPALLKDIDEGKI